MNGLGNTGLSGFLTPNTLKDTVIHKVKHYKVVYLLLKIFQPEDPSVEIPDKHKPYVQCKLVDLLLDHYANYILDIPASSFCEHIMHIILRYGH